MSEVDLVVNTYERTYRKVLGTGLLKEIEQENRFDFARRVVVINNVECRAEAERLAMRAVDLGWISAFVFVEDELDRALSLTNVSLQDIEKTQHFSDWAFVTVTMEGSPWVLHWDADVRLDQPYDWVSPSLELMSRDRRVMVANPSPLEVEPIETYGDFVLTQGFSDQVFLCRRSDFSGPIYKERCIARWRYPMIAFEPIFEARVDSWMRHHDRLRAVHLGSRYTHPKQGEGDHYPQMSPVQGARWAFGICLTAVLRRLPKTPDCCRAL